MIKNKNFKVARNTWDWQQYMAVPLRGSSIQKENSPCIRIAIYCSRKKSQSHFLNSNFCLTINSFSFP